MTDVLEIEPRESRMARWLREAEQQDAAVRFQFDELSKTADDDGLHELRPGDVWPALSIPPATATMVARGELRAFTLGYLLGHTGPVVICSTAKPFTPGCDHRSALCVANIVDELPFSGEHLPALGMTKYDVRLRRQRVIFVNQVRRIVPFQVIGSPGIYRIVAPRPRA